MSKAPLHEWNLSAEDAIALQRDLVKSIIREYRLCVVHHVAVVVISINEIKWLARTGV